MSHTLLICDLDGTLIDSAPGIAEALRQACASVGVEPITNPDRSVIGPPLDALLKQIIGPLDAETLARLRLAFIESYDRDAYLLSKPFDGIQAMLQSVAEQGHEMALATNKRFAPTSAILQHFRWSGFFRSVETTDSKPHQTRTKSEMLADIRLGSGASIRSFFYLGDTEADSQAAREAGMPCIMAHWGYGGASGIPADLKAFAPADVCAFLLDEGRR